MISLFFFFQETLRSILNQFWKIYDSAIGLLFLLTLLCSVSLGKESDIHEFTLSLHVERKFFFFFFFLELHQTTISYIPCSCLLRVIILVSENFEIYPNFMFTIFPCFSKISSLFDTLFRRPFSALHVCILQFDFFHSFTRHIMFPCSERTSGLFDTFLYSARMLFFDFIYSLLSKRYQVRLTLLSHNI